MAKTKTEIAAEFIATMPEQATRTIARALHKSRPKLFPSVENARTLVRTIRGAAGINGERRGVPALKRSHQKPGQTYEMPKSDARAWEPFDLGCGMRVLSLSDIHIPYHDENALRLAVKEGKRFGVDVVLLNGDTIDFHRISRYDQNPEARDPASELKLTAQLLLWLRQEFPKARFVFKEGNHDERWTKFLWNNAPVLYQIKSCRLDAVLAYVIGDIVDSPSIRLSDYGWEYVTDQRPVMAGKLPILHGHELPRGMTSPVNPARGLFLRMVDTALIGHGHRTSQHVEGNWRHTEISCWSQGCLCDLNPGYGRINKWNHGFAIVEVADTGEFDLHNYRIANGKVRAS